MTNHYGKKCLVDTNILIFARDRNSDKHQAAVLLFDEIEKDKFEAYISVQNLLEYSAVLTRVFKLSQSEVKKDLDLLLSNPKLHLLCPTRQTTDIFMKLMGKNSGIYVFDLFLAAIMRENQIDTIITDDEDFRKLPFLNVFDPIG